MKEEPQTNRMGKNQNTVQLGVQSVKLPNPVYIRSYGTVVGKKEGEGPLGERFDLICDTDKFGENTWEEAESRMQREAAFLALGKGGMNASEIRYAIAGDLLGQNIASSFGLKNYEIPLFGVYGACSTIGEGMSLGAMLVSAGYADRVICVASSHFATAEKQFRYPVSYANQRPLSATWTVTGAGAYVLDKEIGSVKITGVTTGRIVDYGVRDAQNMGAAMAPAAMDLIASNFRDFDRTPNDYDRIVTGDLGEVGQQLLWELLLEKGYDVSKCHEDCGMKIFDKETQGTASGGSGCGCSATTLAAYYLPKLSSGELKRVLFLPTGALLSQVSFNEGQSVPGIAHGLVLEHVEQPRY